MTSKGLGRSILSLIGTLLITLGANGQYSLNALNSNGASSYTPAIQADTIYSDGKGIQLVKQNRLNILFIEQDTVNCTETFNFLFKHFPKTDSGYNIRNNIIVQNTFAPFDFSRNEICGYLPYHYNYDEITAMNNRSLYGSLPIIATNGNNPITHINQLNISSNHYNNFRVTRAKIANLNIANNNLSEGFMLNNSDIGHLSVDRNDFYLIGIGGCTIRDALFYGNNVWDCYDQDLRNPAAARVIPTEPDTEHNGYVFSNDTLTGIIQFWNFISYRPNKKTPSIISGNHCVFFHCIINNSISITGQPFKKIEFRDCTFGDEFRIAGNIDTIVLEGNCSISREFNLNSLESYNMQEQNRKPITLIINDGFDVSKLHFDYIEKFQIPLESSQQEAFILLKEKFVREGKLESAKRITIELKKLRYKSGLDGGELVNFMDKWYWAYGYNKLQPITVIGLLLLLFSLFNWFFWKRMKRAYTIGDSEKSDDDTSIQLIELPNGNNKSYKAKFLKLLRNSPVIFQNYLWVLLYTSLIFFSIRIAKDRLHFKGNGWAILAYFVQYLTGLFIMLFTVKFVIGV